MTWVRSSLNDLVVPTKVFCNSIIALPKLISEYLDIKRENQNLRRKIETLKLEVVTLKNTSQELMELKKSMKVSFPIKNLSAIGKVLGYDRTFFDSFLMINVNGTKCTQGDVVISNDGLVGIIHDVHRNTARVRTITDNRIFIPVITKSGERVIMTGNCTENMESAELYDQNNINQHGIKVGDILYTSGEGGVFPINIIVAKVIKVDGLKKKIIAAPVIDFKKIDYVWILNPVTSPRS
jgi:rod shape-determining protein MreC